MSKKDAHEAASGHPGQCVHCGAFRPDGKPPTAHRTGCVDEDPNLMVVHRKIHRVG